MTIFQKLLFVPIMSILFYASFLSYSYFEHQKYSQEISTFSSNYIPQLDISNKNNLLFKQISDIYKDAVLANEVNWLNNTQKIQVTIEDNFKRLELLVQPKDIESIEFMKLNFRQYIKHADKLARMTIENNSIIENESILINDVNHYHNECQNSFLAFSQYIQNQFQQTLSSTNQNFNQILLIGGLISILSVTLLLTTTIIISFSTRKSVDEIIHRMKSLALGDADFSHRLEHSQRDELGYLIHWFNKLSDKLEENHLELERVSITDKLTQLNNRNRADVYFPMSLKQAQESGSIISAIILDIDNFKHINDTFGHMIGDEVLKKMALVLKQNIDKEAFLCRWGGEEFVIVLPNANPKEVYKKIDMLRECIAHTSFDDVGKVTASFGIAISNKDDDVLSIMERADKCLYEAKNQGRNCVVIEAFSVYLDSEVTKIGNL